MLSRLRRSIWTFAYHWLGYAIGTKVEAAASFLRTSAAFSLLVLSASIAVFIKGIATRLVSP
jgi:hypothetical protein